ncbi:hypothetical protein ASH00_08950 [Arthrobacter sp. Soil782]|uniref:hypothetical protein n=1 Tax=Arthrobacter sp. Soil782 TaxID=1736410 RepID=UPI0006FB1FC2|nr:hypothetical protein [Arthrobacter sp. Soil782]KRF06357.1 hypothetical protein ASH00_08950 [Arthrobacter sp. Soil782]
MYWLTDLLTPPLAILSALVGLLLAVDQLTAAARLKRESSFWREEMLASDLRHDREVMESLHRTATARLIAIKVVPARRLLVPAYFFIAGIVLTFSFAHVVGSIAPQPITLESISAAGLDVISSIFIPVLVFMGMIGIASVFIRRRHLIRSYLDGEIIADRPPRFTEDGGVWLGFRLGNWKWIVFGIFAFGLCSFTAAVGFTLGVGVDSIQSWTALWLVASFMLLFFSFSPVPTLYRMGREKPIHPRRLTDKASVRRGVTGEGSPDVREWRFQRTRGTHARHKVSASRQGR